MIERTYVLDFNERVINFIKGAYEFVVGESIEEILNAHDRHNIEVKIKEEKSRKHTEELI